MKKRPRILFCIENVRHGGISKALESILSEINRDNYEIGVFCINSTDGSYKEFFKRFLAYKQKHILYYLSTYYKEHSGIKKYILLMFKTICKILKIIFKFDVLEYCLNRESEKISKENYDVVIAYSEGLITKFASQIKATKKIAWIHIDYKRYLEYCNHSNEESIYDAYDTIIIPSDFSRESFIDVFPSLRDKVITMHNLLNITDITEKAKERLYNPDFYNKEYFQIISIGRICHEKGFANIPQIAKALRERGNKFKWYIIGNGSDIETNYLKQTINKKDVEDVVILLGEKENPYPYIKACDLVAVTSISETFSYVIGEAKIIGTPIISTNFGTAKEVLNNKIGIIANIDEFPDKIHELINNKNIYHELKTNIEKYQHDNSIVLKQLNSILSK